MRRSVLSFRDIHFTYPGALGGGALCGVDLNVAPGSRVVVLGANGSGKSTLVRLSNGLSLPDSGQVTVDSLCTEDESNLAEIRRRVGMVFQRPEDQIVATTVEEDVAFGPENLGICRAELRIRVDEALAAVGLSGLERREPHLLSGGQKQCLAIAGAIAMRPSYLVLDEPTSMLDPRGREDVGAIISALQAAGTGILHVTHDLVDLVGADVAIVLNRGYVVYNGSPGDLLSRSELLRDCGLELPGVFSLGIELRALGVELPSSAMTPAGILESLWR